MDCIGVAAFKNDFVPLVEQPHHQAELPPRPPWLMLGPFDLELGPQDIALENRFLKRGLLLDQCDHGALELLGERSGAQCGKRHEMKSVHDGAAKARAPGIFLIVMDGVAVAGERSERSDIRSSNLSRAALENLAPAEIFKEELRRLFRHLPGFRP